MNWSIKPVLIILYLLLGGLSVLAQDVPSAMLRGHLQNEEGVSISEATISIESAEVITSSDILGNFEVAPLSYGDYEVVFYTPGYAEKKVQVSIQSEITDMGDIVLSQDKESSINSFQQRIPSVEVGNEIDDIDNGITAGVSSILNSNMDAFVRIASYNFGPLRYRIRGYQSNQVRVLINNIPMNDAITGNTVWSHWGGLNDVFRSRTSIQGLFPSEVSFGGLYGANVIDASASNQRKQTRLTYSATNRSYRNRLMLTHSSGLTKSGWAYSLSGSMRWSESGYMPGTRYDGKSYFLAVDKVFNDRHKLGLITFGTPTTYGKIAPVVGEIYDIAGKYYNPNWGYQNGEVRNAKERTTFMPTSILHYTYTPNKKNLLYVALSNQRGIHQNSTLDWYNAPDPRPDYYRYLPTWQDDPTMRVRVTESLRQNPDQLQINWDRLYNTNYMSRDTLRDTDGSIIKAGKWSRYVQGAFVEEIDKWTVSPTWLSAISDNITMTLGVIYQHQVMQNYKKLLDLLGGDFYVNINQFALREYASNNRVEQYDLQKPNRILGEGDRYNYNYNSIVSNTEIWNQWQFKYKHIEAFISGALNLNSYQRDGKFQNGLFAGNSLGKSEKVDFTTFNIKGGLTYKLNGRNYLYTNGGILRNTPDFRDVFISPQMNNYIVSDPKTVKIKTLEMGYMYRSPNFKLGVNTYASDFEDVLNIIRFYNDDENAFVNYVMSDVNYRNIGLEIGVEHKLSSSWTATGAFALGQSYFTDNPTVTVFNQNDTTATPTRTSGKTVYYQNYYTGNGPQTALGLGISYNSKKYWFVTLNVNYLDRNYVSPSPERHTAAAVDALPSNSYDRSRILKQEKLPAAITMDFFGGKSFIIKRNKNTHHNTLLFVNLGVNNLLNNTNIFTGGFEQLRLNHDNLEVFGNKYFRAYGLNYFLNLSLSL